MFHRATCPVYLNLLDFLTLIMFDEESNYKCALELTINSSFCNFLESPNTILGTSFLNTLCFLPFEGAVTFYIHTKMKVCICYQIQTWLQCVGLRLRVINLTYLGTEVIRITPTNRPLICTGINLQVLLQPKFLKESRYSKLFSERASLSYYVTYCKYI
jgi:hypothetical protein